MLTQQKKSSQKGFTLVEMAIVLVIIGLLLGGVLKGQELIANARMKASISQIQQLTAAVYTYQDKTEYLPGDDPNATVKDSGTGLGDGAISADESKYVFKNLQDQNLISGSFTPTTAGAEYAKNKFGGNVEILSNGAALGATAVTICLTGLSGAEATQIDTKMDDGIATTGSVQVADATTITTQGTSYSTTAANTVCVKM
ncbi:prepilin-type N-terminal cleavage/methylation domain-containing protein [Hydrogenovibrio kuenenii]|uniref:prepilin-type N-terminal cleavage/methylation domain-containing protein n=1 Tax=Hydrogenovibrio kuenenii TaxID=63658 RepID=UPI000464C159|nr:prepilin-type N-terminal cleavage/methylation domain-containing protein [Hydrogenovibrio kuenenii]